MFELAVLIISSSLNLLLGLGVYLKNTRSITNRLFFMMTGSFALWSVVNYFSVHPSIFSQLTWIRLVMFTAAFLCLSVFLTFDTFPNHAFQSSRRTRRLAIAAAVLMMPLTLTSFIFKNLKIVNGSAQPEPNIGIGLFFVLVVGLLGGGVYMLVKKYKKAHGLQKLQIKLVLLGLAGTFGLIVTTDFLLVVLFKYSRLVPLGPAYTLIFSGALGYAIVRHRLFDIRAAVARSMAYVLVLGSMSAIYAAGLFGVIDVIFKNPDQETPRQVFAIALTMPLIISFQAIKRYFDRFTNRVFYHNAYDTQEVLDRLGGVIVAEIDLDKILTGTRRTLEEPLKSSFIEFILIREHKPQLVSGREFQGEPVKELLASRIEKQDKELVDRDELGLDSPLRKILSDNNISASLRLRTRTQTVGYVLFGDKKSGDIYSHQDLRLLAIVADELAIAIQNALRFEEIQQFNITLQEKIEAATNELRQANHKLRELDATKDEFISMASHQLRTPLTTIKGYLSMVLEGDVGPVTKNERKMIQQAFNSAEQMVYLIADLLNVSRLQSGKFVITNKPTDLAKTVQAIIDQLKGTAEQHRLKLIYEPPTQFPTLDLDEDKIRQVIMNFLDNAIYYTPSGGSITVSLTASDDTVAYTVTDTGLGVPKAEQHHLFSKFYRAGNARKMRPDGTGLGLFMAKKVILAQGGAIIFKSEEGKGSTFGFSFPRTKMEVKKSSAPPEALKVEKAKAKTPVA